MKAITTTYHGPTISRGSRIVAHDSDGNRVTMPINYAIDITPKVKKQPPDLTAGEFNRREC